MEKQPRKTEQQANSYDSERERRIENFYQKHFEGSVEGVRRITIEDLRELKEKEISVEQFLNWLCQKQNALLHGSVFEIKNGVVQSQDHKVYATDSPAIAILKSVYTNVGANLEYPYFITDKEPLQLKIHTPLDREDVSVEQGFVYVLDREGFENEPEGSWQFVAHSNRIGFSAIIETTKGDFEYPVEILQDKMEKF